MQYLPLNYEQINIAAGSYNPSPVKAYNNYTFAYWQRSLFQRAASALVIELPDEWQGTVRDFFNYCLYRFGYVAIFRHDKYGLTFQPCSLTGYNWYYQPTKALIPNPALKETLELTIPDQCCILKLTPDFIGVWDIVTYYAEKLSSLDNAINMSIINSKFGLLIGAKNKSAAQALKKMLDAVNKGEPAVIYDKQLINANKPGESPFEIPDLPRAKDNYMLSEQLQDFQTLLNSFDAEIGIPTIPYAKKERMVTQEAGSRVIDSVSRITVWNETINSCIDIIKEHYPEIKLSCRLRYDIDDLMAGQTEGSEVPENE